jgi:hypothetical protein
MACGSRIQCLMEWKSDLSFFFILVRAHSPAEQEGDRGGG